MVGQVLGPGKPPHQLGLTPGITAGLNFGLNLGQLLSVTQGPEVLRGDKDCFSKHRVLLRL